MRAFTSFSHRFLIRFVLPLALVTWLTGCYKEVDDLQLRQGSKLVIHSFISPQDTVLTVRVTQSTPFFRSVKTGGVVTNATVRLSDGITTVELAHRREGTYAVAASQLSIRPDQTYFLTVTTPEGLRAEASCTVPKQTIDAIHVQLEPQLYEQYEGFSLNVEWQDTPGEGDYYRIFAESPTLLLYTKQGPNQPEKTDTIHPYPLYFSQDEVYTQDIGKDGQKFRVAAGGLITGGFNTRTNQYIQLLERKVRVMLLRTDGAYYQYHQDLPKFGNNNVEHDDPFVEPSLVFTNIEGGLGVFAAYQKYEKEVEF